MFKSKNDSYPAKSVIHRTTPDHIFKEMFNNFDSKQMFNVDRLDLIKLFLEPADAIDWIKNKSTSRKVWSEFLVREHQECKNWVVFQTM